MQPKRQTDEIIENHPNEIPTFKKISEEFFKTVPLREKNRPKTKAEINFSLKEIVYLIDFDMLSTNVHVGSPYLQKEILILLLIKFWSVVQT